MSWRILHDTLKWMWPALFAGIVSLGGLAVAAAQVWPEAKVAVGRLFVAGIEMLTALSTWLAFAALVVAWLAVFIWSGHKVSAPDEAADNPDMPLYLACRWIARDSAWAAQLHPSRDNDWVSLVDAVLMSKVNLGRIALFGVPRDRGGSFYPLPKEFTDHAQWENHNLVASENPPTHMWAASKAQVDPSTYYDVRLDSRQVKRAWPRRSLWARIMRRSPVERIGDYGPIFEKQDAAYNKRHGFFDVPLQAVLSEATR